METWLILLDKALLVPFRIPADPFVGYWLGCFTSAALATAVGEGTAAALRRVNGQAMHEASQEVGRLHDNSIAALRAGDRGAYDATNRLAKEAFGKWFFMTAAAGTSALWPVFLLAGWLHLRFGHVEFPLPWTDATVSFVAPLVVCYVGIRLALGWSRRRWPVRAA